MTDTTSRLHGSGICLAIEEAEKLNLEPSDLYSGQFQFSRDSTPPIAEYLSVKIGERYLHHSASLDIVRIFAADTLCAILIGVALNAEGKLLAGDLKLDLKYDSDLHRKLEEIIAGFVGRFAVFTSTPSGQYVYTDTVGEMGVVFDRETGIVGSTLPIILYRPINERDDFLHIKVQKSLGQYSLGYTTDKSCWRLMPNHSLKMDTFEQARFWPTDNALMEPRRLRHDEVIDRLIALLRQNTVGFLEGKPCLMALSGGQDSRMLLAASRDKMHLAKMIFGTDFGWNSGRDCDAAEIIAERVGLSFKRITGNKPKRWGKRVFLARVGYAVNAGGTDSIKIYNKLPKDHLLIRGNVFGLTRANDWNPRKDSVANPSNVRFGMKRLKMGQAISDEIRPSDLKKRYLDWRNSLPDLCRENSLDFSFCENYLPNSLGARNYSHTNVTLVNPFADRRIIMLCLAIPPLERKHLLINEGILNKTAPDLADIPFV